MSTPISFDRLGNLPFTRAAVYNKATNSAITLEHGLKDLADINNTTVMSLDLLEDPTMYNGKFHVLDNGSHTEYFPSEFSTTPGVFFTLQWEPWGNGDGTRANLVITSVTTKYFTITNTNGDMDPIVHWMAVKPGNGNIYGKNYECEVVSSGNNWGTNRTFTYANMGNNPFVMYCVNSRNSGSNVYTTSYNTISSTQALFYTGVNADSDVKNNQTVSTSEQLAYLSIKNSGDVVNKMYMWTGTEKSVAYNVHTTTTNGAVVQNIICLGLVKAGGGNAATLYANRVTNKRIKWYIKEYNGMDGTHGAEPTVMLQIAGTTTRKAKPFWHLCANHLNAVQGVSANSHVDRWYNLSQRAFKYAVGRTESGSQKPTLKSDSNGYYVNFNNTNQEYFDIPVPVTWEFADTDGVGTKGITAFCVMKFTDTSQSWSRFFDFGNGPGVDNLLWAKIGSGQEMRLEGHDPTATYDSTNTPISTSWAVYTVRYNNCDKTAKFWVDNLAHTPNETATATLTDRTTTINYIGNSNWTGDAEMHSSMREQIVYDDTLTDDQVSDINLHLCEKWGITPVTYPVIGQWYLVFRQTMPYVWSTTTAANFTLNAGDPSNANYSILNTITDFKNTDGKYRLKYVDPANNNMNDFRVTSNITTEVQAGLENISIHYSGSGWGGLGPSGATNSTHFDGSPGSNWWFGFGTKLAYGSNQIPGLGYAHSAVEVWAMKEN
jgi:hypothetical protein